ncbi:MAG: sterol desaturase family protein [Pseudomonadota bacterium]
MTATILEFLAIWAAVYAATVAAYFGLGNLLIWVNNRHPERRIQPLRRGEKRAREEILNSLRSLIVTCFCLAGGIFVQLQGWTLWQAGPLLSWWTLVWFAVSVVAFDTWFYWGHRLMHSKRLYKFHFLHHRSVAPTVWSQYSDGEVDAFVMQSFYLFAPMILPLHPLVLIAHRTWDHINGQIGHSGFEYFADQTTRFPSPMVCVTFHDQHHEHFRYNYANFFSFWDRLCGTLHPDYDTKVQSYDVSSEKTPAE